MYTDFFDDHKLATSCGWGGGGAVPASFCSKPRQPQFNDNNSIGFDTRLPLCSRNPTARTKACSRGQGCSPKYLAHGTSKTIKVPHPPQQRISRRERQTSEPSYTEKHTHTHSNDGSLQGVWGCRYRVCRFCRACRASDACRVCRVL